MSNESPTYRPVEEMIQEFRGGHPAEDGWAIRTWLVSKEGDRVVVQASICDKDDHIVAQGTASSEFGLVRTAEKIAVGAALSHLGIKG
jgi:hypothetical protein